MKKVLILYPHWHPVNLAGVHRPRLIGNFLQDYGWKPRVLTVEEKFFEEDPDPNFFRTFSKDMEVTRVKAMGISRPRIIGDIGLRAFYQLYKKALKIIEEESIHFLWLPIPSFYNALLGRVLYEKTGVPYGIDYIDPWVFDQTNQNTIRSKISLLLANFLEPIALKKAALVSGVSMPYYEPALRRNFPTFFDVNGELKPETENSHTKRKISHVSMPYGFDPQDHEVVLPHLNFPWDADGEDQKIWLYAGAFLPNSHLLLKAFFEAIRNLRKKNLWDEKIRLWFIGTGAYPAKQISAYAADFGLQDIVRERRNRYPFLEVLNFLSAADTVMIIGSTEKHYTASKTFQALLSKRPVFSVFHKESSAVEVMQQSFADNYTVLYDPDTDHAQLVSQFEEKILKRLRSNVWNPDLTLLNQFSAKESARKLVDAIEKVID